MKKSNAFTLAEIFHPAEQSKKNAFTLAEVFHPVEQSKKNAFTLAEVLITLGIIGVVAALTIPSLIANHKKQVTETRLKKFYSTMNQAILNISAEYGDYSNWYGDFHVGVKRDESGNIIARNDEIDEAFNKYLAKYIKHTSKKINGETFYLLPDGSSFKFAMQTNQDVEFFPQNFEKCLQLTPTENLGTCRFKFIFTPLLFNPSFQHHQNKGLEPYKYGWNGKPETLQSNCENNGEFCTALIQYNGWKIPDNYPRKLK